MDVLHHLTNFLTRVFGSWIVFIGTSPAGLLIQIATLLLAEAKGGWLKKETWSNWRDNLSPTLRRSFVALGYVWAASFVFYMPITIYKDHQELVAGLVKLEQERDSLRTEVKNLKQSNLPDFEPIIQYNPSFAQHPIFPKDTVVTVLLRMVNRGAPSITQGWKMNVQLPDGSLHEGLKLIPAFKTIKFYTNNTGSGPTQMELQGKDEIEEKTAEIPVERGGSRSGFIIFVVKDVNYLTPREAGTKVTLSFIDTADRRYEVSSVMHGQGPLQQPIFVPGLTTQQ